MNRKLCSILLFSFLIVVLSCQREHEKIDLVSINVEINIHRFEQDLFKLNADSLGSSIPMLKSSCGDFLNLFGEQLIGIGRLDEPGYTGNLKKFITDKQVLESFGKVDEVFPSLDPLNGILTDAFKRYHYYFPEKEIPAVYSFISGFNQSIVIADSILAIGLERYLGRDCKYYDLLGIPRFISYNMHPQKIPSDCMRSWAIGEFPFNDSIDNLANNIIYEGMLIYFTKKMLPDEPDSIILGFSPSQMEWCKNNEKNIWTHLIENRLLFNDDSFIISKLINSAPFTSGFPQESPGRTAVWTGYRIVQSFMKNNEGITFPDLMKITDYQSILNRSKYKP